MKFWRKKKLSAKEFYKRYVADEQMYELNHVLVKNILSYKPQSVLEFGCGPGKHLVELSSSGIAKLSGIDISPKAVEVAKKKGLDVSEGTENSLKSIESNSYDIVFTCSVLDHIENIEDLVSDLSRIAKTAVIVAETNDVIGDYYYPHNYLSLGFTDSGYSWKSDLQPPMMAEYRIYIKNKS